MNRNLFTFGDISIQKKLDRISRTNPLFRIEKLIDWGAINEILSECDSRNKSHYGRDCYSPLSMFKILFLQALYNFTDRQIEEHLLFNTLFLWFCGFSIDSEIPDHSTIARWRERFENADIYDKAFFEINNQLSDKGLSLTNAMVVDASLVESKSRPKRKVTVVVEPVGDELTVDDNIYTDHIDERTNVKVEIEESKDPDARWLKKGKKSYYGYKKNVSTNTEGFINGVITTPANVADTTVLPDLVELVNPDKRIRLYADKGYASKNNRDFLKKKKLKDAIMYKKTKSKELSAQYVILNKIISKTRFVVERTFGCLKQNLKSGRSWYVGLKKTHNFIMIRAIAHNLIRAVNYVVG